MHLMGENQRTVVGCTAAAVERTMTAYLAWPAPVGVGVPVNMVQDPKAWPAEAVYGAGSALPAAPPTEVAE